MRIFQNSLDDMPIERYSALDGCEEDHLGKVLTFETISDNLQIQALTAGNVWVKVFEPLAGKSSGFFVALSKLNHYKPTFEPIAADRLTAPSWILPGLVAQLVRAHA
jgi:hypothetical protein